MATDHRTFKTLLLFFVTGSICGIAYLDYTLGFGFNLFPLYLVPLALVAWYRGVTATLLVAALAGALIIFKFFFIKELYAHRLFWFWDALVKFSLLFIFSYGLWRLRQLLLLQREQNARQVNELNRSLQKQVEQLTAANRELSEVSYTISHDLRAPLRHIAGFVELLKTRTPECLDQQSRHYLAVIGEAARTMGNLVDDLLAFTQLGRSELVRKEVDLAAVLRLVLRELAETTREREIEWQIAPLPVVVGDPRMLHQVLYNLVHNALKFTRPRRPARIEIGYRELSGEKVIFVRDNGVGFDMRYLNKLFGRFQRLHPGSEFEGTGMGLANVQRIVARHGGRVWAEGVPDQGATFWFTLPG
ncbi:hypothetical protein GMST_09860 [Geomonas silvestris]|uniref:histidine kinase n=1 Tax=Geomonas silvestris TaxID=2740184 RepID=A0A6V8MF92_9BACT|nr:ATP-binding protein [Geomonas silvestris]GFO58661.1 hypothetical protein GMST_09860 [Geomonas silvestris]